MNDPRALHSSVAHDGHDDRHYGAVHTPIYDTSLFTFPSVASMERAAADEGTYVYSRGNNPTVRALENKLAELEGGERARCFATGMGAISAAVLSSVRAGEHIVCVDQAYGPARELMGGYLRRLEIWTTFVDGRDLAAVEAAIRPETKLLYLESPTSLFFELQDLRRCASLARARGIRTIVDNTYATPCHQNPLAFGIDLVVHSLTKYAGGHSDAMGGVVVGSAAAVEALSRSELVLLGSVMLPQTAALIMRGLRTLPLRMERHQAGGMAVAAYLDSLPFVDRVHYPGLSSHPQLELAHAQMSGFGGLLSFEAGDDRERLVRFVDALDYFRIGFSWGGYESLASLQEGRAGSPRTRRQAVRLYVGLEEREDLIGDLANAFRAAGF
ncbi:trans-sulfuration enzyme family protein [Paenibacillus glycinis]|uniref:Aminotransferase class I/II-fold pyridoxal phosphate-dependent enzyme n=1 Tax=Paenibacillus glycinis TaxID=2697035 RepID=A0ABW9XM61_9BACL|nr:aminotransferase class I/II-fold pyridoxal phosphate-dependent enzyme [Paenibacillus glycinis]NBD23694.1 aminotransferase class I/II-fold pyridoxal phosphate-dependent enzyme [Paenibacillus glycinis]